MVGATYAFRHTPGLHPDDSYWLDVFYFEEGLPLEMDESSIAGIVDDSSNGNRGAD